MEINFSIHDVAILRHIAEQVEDARKEDGSTTNALKRIAFECIGLGAQTLIQLDEEERSYR